MKKVLIIADVENSAKWEAGFRTHVDHFRSMSVNKPVQFTLGENNEVAVCFEPENLDKFLESMDTPENAEAMAYDGVKRETVKVFILDKELKI